MGNHPLELEMNVKWDGTITLRVTQWVHFVLGVWIVTGTQACRCNRYSYSTPSRCSPAAFQPADLSHLTLGGNSPFALSVPPRPLAAKLLNLEARNYLNLKSTLGNLQKNLELIRISYSRWAQRAVNTGIDMTVKG